MSIIVCLEDPKDMDNDALHILRTLYEEGSVDAYELHKATKIPPTTLFITLEQQRNKGLVEREDIRYSLTEKGETLLASELGDALMRPSLSFKKVPEKFSGPKALIGDVSVISKIVQ